MHEFVNWILFLVKSAWKNSGVILVWYDTEQKIRNVLYWLHFGCEWELYNEKWRCKEVPIACVWVTRRMMNVWFLVRNLASCSLGFQSLAMTNSIAYIVDKRDNHSLRSIFLCEGQFSFDSIWLKITSKCCLR